MHLGIPSFEKVNVLVQPCHQTLNRCEGGLKDSLQAVLLSLSERHCLDLVLIEQQHASVEPQGEVTERHVASENIEVLVEQVSFCCD